MSDMYKYGKKATKKRKKKSTTKAPQQPAGGGKAFRVAEDGSIVPGSFYGPEIQPYTYEELEAVVSQLSALVMRREDELRAAELAREEALSQFRTSQAQLQRCNEQKRVLQRRR